MDLHFYSVSKLSDNGVICRMESTSMSIDFYLEPSIIDEIRDFALETISDRLDN